MTLTTYIIASLWPRSAGERCEKLTKKSLVILGGPRVAGYVIGPGMYT